jgi:hypothetical protein
LKYALEQVKMNKTGFSIQPIRFDKNTHISITYQNKKKDFQVVINKKDGGYIGMQKTWEW